MKTNVTIIGFGTMGKAIAKALARDSSIKIFTVDVDKKDVSGIKKSDFIILSVKPQDAENAIKQLKNYGLNKNTILISIMAGVPMKKISLLSGHKKIIRMMPNLALSIAGWISAGLSPIEKKKAKKFLDEITENFEVKKEDDINKITAISGSGPAYFFLLAKELTNTARKLGLKEAEKLVQKTFQAAAHIEGDYAELVKKVASKGGTTEAALKVLKFDKMTEKAVLAAYKKAKELS